MAQSFTISLVLLFFAALNPIVCPSSQMYKERRDRAPYIETSEYSPQSLGDTVAPVGSRLRKAPSYRDKNVNHRSPDEVHKPPSSSEQEITDSIVDKNIRSVFSTNFGPGLHLFKNTAPFVNQSHFNSFHDPMVSDQPDPHIPPSTASSNDRDFKIQRSPNGKLSVVYKDDIDSKEDDNTTNNQSSGSSKESFENRFQTHFPGGLPLKTNKLTTATPTEEQQTRTKDSAIHFPTEEPDTKNHDYKIDSNDCLEDDGTKKDKLYCTHVRNYPDKNYLEGLIKKKFPNLETFFSEDLILPQNISHRMANAPNEEYLCKSRTRVIYPESGVNKDYDWLFIVNLPNYKQGVRIEECVDVGQTCGLETGLSLPLRFTATCEQMFVLRSLIAYANATDKSLSREYFLFPSCCKCVLKTSYQ